MPVDHPLEAMSKKLLTLQVLPVGNLSQLSRHSTLHCVFKTRRFDYILFFGRGLSKMDSYPGRLWQGRDPQFPVRSEQYIILPSRYCVENIESLSPP